MINSVRKFAMSFSDQGSVKLTTLECSLDEILEDDGSELNYALQEDIDSILDLRIGETKYFSASRDDDSKGIILRIK